MRAGEALRAAADERRKAQQSRADTERRAREEAERLVADLRGELETARVALERGQLTAPAIDTVLERAEDRLARAPVAAKPRVPARRDGGSCSGLESRRRGAKPLRGLDRPHLELDRSKRRATIEAGAMRISVDIADLEPIGAAAGEGLPPAAAASAGTNVAELRLSRSRSVPMSLDLRGARVEEALAALESYLEDASLAGLAEGHRDPRSRDRGAPGCGPVGGVRAPAREVSSGQGERGEGGDGVTVVEVG